MAKGVAAGLVNSMGSFSVTSGGCPTPPCNDRKQFSNENQLLGRAGQYDTPLSNVAQDFPELPQAAAVSTMAYNPIDKYLAGSNPARLRAIEPSFIAKVRTWGIGEEIVYNIVNDGYLAVRTVFLKPFLGNDIRNLDGTLSTARERQMAFAMTAGLIITTSAKGLADSRTYTIMEKATNTVYKFGVTDAQLTRYRRVLQELGEAYYGRVSQSIMPKWQAHRMEKYLRSLHYNNGCIFSGWNESAVPR